VQGRAAEVVGASDVAVVASGTATLEAALMQRPLVVVYRVAGLSWAVGRALVKLKHVSLPNLLAGRGVVPELLQAAFTAEAAPGRSLDTVVSLREALGSEVLMHFSVAASSAEAPDASEFIESLEDAGTIFVARVHPQTKAREGEPLRLVVNTRRLHFFDVDTGEAIYGDGDSRLPARASLAVTS